MRAGRVILPAACGVIVALVILAVVEDRPGPGGCPGGPLLSDCDGALGELVIQYVPSAGPGVLAAYRDFLRQLPGEVTVLVVCPELADGEALVSQVSPTACRLRPLAVSHAMTSWARDRWLALAPGSGSGTALLCPRAEQAAEVWPARAGDEGIAFDLAAAVAGVSAERSPLYFDGGDFLADDRTAFVAPAVLRRNLPRTVASRQELVSALAARLKREVLLLEDAPDHHLGMFMMPAGQGVVLVGDPGAGRRLLDASAADASTRPAGANLTLPAGARASDVPSDLALCPPDGPDFSPGVQARFDAVAAQCAAAGYSVVRIPILPGKDGRTYLTYLNVIIDQRGGQRTVYMPTYRSADALNAAAADIWRSLGYRVCPVDCTDAYVHFGALHCLVNVLSRTP